MATTTPWMTSADLIASVKRKISFPISQSTFTEADILAFANEEMAISQVPAILEYHEEYFVYKHAVPLVSGQIRYPIPDRALGMKLRDLKYVDVNDNLFDMSRVAPEDKAYFQNNIGTSETLSKYYVEGNDIVLLPHLVSTDAMSLVFYYFLRPNQLVDVSRAATITSFLNQITVVNANLSIGDSVYIKDQTFIATAGVSISSSSVGSPTVITTSSPHGIGTGQLVTISGNTTGTPINGTYVATVIDDVTFSIPVNVTVAATNGSVILTNSQFLIGSGDIQTAINLSTAINSNGVCVASYGNPASSVVTLSFMNVPDSRTVIANSDGGLIVPSGVQMVQFNQVPTTYTDQTTFVTTPLFVDGAQIDFLQTKPGHKTYNFDVTIPSGGISGNTVTFNQDDVKAIMIIGDYMALANECIIPQIPPDLHNELAQRTCTMILAAIGDSAGAQTAASKIQEMEKHNISILDNRVESSPLKVNNLKSVLRYQSFGSRRRRL